MSASTASAKGSPVSLKEVFKNINLHIDGLKRAKEIIIICPVIKQTNPSYAADIFQYALCVMNSINTICPHTSGSRNTPETYQKYTLEFILA